MAFTDIFIKRPVLALVVSLLILLIGLRAAMVLPIRQYPRLSNTVVNVTTVYPGASAELIQGFITTPIEQAVASAEGVDYITSSSVLGTSTIQVYIKLNFDPNQALTEVLAKVASVKYLIPKESNDPVVTKTTGGLIILPRDHYLLTRKTRSLSEMAHIGKSACDQCSYCTEFCPRYLLGYEVMPHKVMRSLGFTLTGEQIWNQWSELCCACGLCTLYACPEDLYPKEACDQGKQDRRSAGLTSATIASTSSELPKDLLIFSPPSLTRPLCIQ